MFTNLAALLFLAAAVLHAGLVDDHLEEWWGYGLFFILASIAQGVYALVLFAMPERPQWEPAAWRDFRVRLFSAGIIGNLLVVALYVVTRTVGIPFFGPDAGEVEAVEAVDLVTKGTELASVLVLAWLVRMARQEAIPERATSDPLPM